MVVRSSGATGEVRWSYLTAVSFGPWSAELTRAGGVVTAQIARVDPYRVSQRPLSLVLPYGARTASWPVDTLQIAGDTLTVCVGPRGER